MTRKPPRPPLFRSLSARLLVLTVFFVMVTELAVFAPSIGRYRLTYLQERLAAGHLAILAVQMAPPPEQAEMTRELLHFAGAYAIGLRRPDGVKLMLEDPAAPPPPADLEVSLHDPQFFPAIAAAFDTLAHARKRVLHIYGPSPKHPQAIVNMIIDDGELREYMIAYSYRILGLSILISVVTATLVYLSLQWLMVRPLRRISEGVTAFRDSPEDASRTLPPTARSDEIGMVQRALIEMQHGLRAALQQKTRLAALGIAVTKISHDLRSILATVRLLSDRLVDSDDPEVRRITPKLLTAVDRAVDLTTNTLRFTTEGPIDLHPTVFDLRELAEEAGAVMPPAVDQKAVWNNLIAEPLRICADRDQLFRVLVNLGQNAVQAGATRIDVSASRAGGLLTIRVGDNGPGLPPRARENLFQPFAGSARPGGSGLGLAISREVMRAHGGDIVLESSTGEGTVFRLHLPLRGEPS
ncbi:MAG: HAMP domain-containing histidine kinase [Rhodospirillaceae bacterium]|nr:HAMP domain-containing histidine kinase [Rhodospirillaceae bacterium]